MSEYSDQERLVFCTATHWVKYVYNAFKNHVLALIGVLLLYVADKASVEEVSIVMICVGSALLLFAHHNFFHKLMSESMYDIFVTTERIIYFDDSLFIENSEHEIPLHRIAGVEVKQKGLVQNILNYGTLWIDTGGGSIDFKRCMPYVPAPEDMSETIAPLVHHQSKHFTG